MTNEHTKKKPTTDQLSIGVGKTRTHGEHSHEYQINEKWDLATILIGEDAKYQRTQHSRDHRRGIGFRYLCLRHIQVLGHIAKGERQGIVLQRS